MHKKQFELKTIYSILALLFLIFLMMPIGLLLYQSFVSKEALSLSNYITMFQNASFIKAFQNSFVVSGISACLTTLIAFLLAYTINFTNTSKRIKKVIQWTATLPMLLPTITYGFAIIYTFGKQGFVTKLLHVQLFDIYGFKGLMIGYMIYTLPIAFLLLNNTMKYIDKKFLIVSKLMQDHTWHRFYMTVLLPLIPTIAAACIQSFFLSFTDFGIPAAVGGEYAVVATTLYNEMLGAVPNFQNGAVVAMMMLLPSIISILILNYLERYQVRYHKVTIIDLPKHRLRDRVCASISSTVCFCVLSVFLVILLLPFVSEWPYDTSFTFSHVIDTLSSGNLLSVYRNSVLVALGTAFFGTMIAYGAALVTTRSKLPKICKKSIDSISSISNTIPGMVIGIAFLFAFSGTSLQTTFVIIILCNMVHFFSTPYVMAKNTLGKMNISYETTAMLMKDSWLKTLWRVIIPNSKSTILEMLSYYFINAMVTISALIFIVGAKTAVLTTKIKELQHFAKFDEIFVLSILILITNLVMKAMIYLFTQKRVEKQKAQRFINVRRAGLIFVAGCMLLVMNVSGNRDTVVIYSNADEEALSAMRHALDEHGFVDQYILQSFGTSELGGKILAEGTNLEADMITMSTYYIDSAQEQQQMFENLTFRTNTIKAASDYSTPLTALEGALIINTNVLAEQGLPVPRSIKDLMNEQYKGFISIPDIKASSTGWLFVQAIINTYGNEEGAQILEKIIANVGPHLESSGSGPLKKVRSGEVGIAFGLRHQAIADQVNGLPIQVIDPIEGNYTLTESIAIVKKDEVNKTAMAMARCIMENARQDLLITYPSALYEGEEVQGSKASTYPSVFKYPLTVDLLKEHQAFFEACIK